MRVTRIFLAAGASCFIASAAPPATAEAAINIHVYNVANVPPVTVSKALSVAEGLMESANVKTLWRQRKSAKSFIFDPKRTPMDLFVRILPESISSRFSKQSTILGFAQPTAGTGYRYVASVFYSRVLIAARDVGASPSVLLGHVLAHELGHLLLGPDAHALRGIMQCPWNVDDVNAAGQGRLRFSPAEMERMRNEIAERAVAASTTRVAD